MSAIPRVFMILLVGVLLGFLYLPGFHVAVRAHMSGVTIGSRTRNSATQRVNLTDASANSGAVCLDGSPGAYYFKPGSGSGSNNWIIELQGGAWCSDTDSCSIRAGTCLGSTVITEPSDVLSQTMSNGIMDSHATSNPDFYNWNMVFVLYCDGASFSGDVDAPVEVPQGRANSGCSAGGLAALLHCDQFRAKMPETTVVKCFSDASFFLDQRDVDGNYSIRERFQRVVALQNVAPNLLPECIYARDASEAWQCFFPQYFIQYMKTPFYIFNSGYDSWQLGQSLIPVADWKPSNGAWRDCYYDFSSCTPEQFALISGFRDDMVSILSTVMSSNNYIDQGGIFVSSCRMHCIQFTNKWNGAVRINNVTLADAIGDWYFGRNTMDRIQIDEAFPVHYSCCDGRSPLDLNLDHS